MELHRKKNITYIRMSLISKIKPHQICLENSYCPRHLLPSCHRLAQKCQLSASARTIILHVAGGAISRDSLHQPSEGQAKAVPSPCPGAAPARLLKGWDPASPEPTAAALPLPPDKGAQPASSQENKDRRWHSELQHGGLEGQGTLQSMLPKEEIRNRK